MNRKILLYINLSVGIQMDMRMNNSLENVTFMFYKEFLRFRSGHGVTVHILRNGHGVNSQMKSVRI